MSPLQRATAFAGMALLVAACSGGGGATTTIGVVFGEGELPASVPDDFPIPGDAVVGTTLVDKINNNTEFRLSVRADPTSVVQFFQVELVNAGYVVDRSEGNQAEWTMEFSKGELTGDILFTAPQATVTAMVVSIATS